MKHLTIALPIILVVFGCGKKNTTQSVAAENETHTSLKYAEGFSISYQGNNKLVEVKYPFQGA
ncbi:MAG: hypothetical protein C0490_17000, partial [Marivirga sp.]|nr:hypothetical protein [Marivirga sp.]